MTVHEADQIVRAQFVSWWPTALVQCPYGALILDRYRAGAVPTMREALDAVKETR